MKKILFVISLFVGFVNLSCASDDLFKEGKSSYAMPSVCQVVEASTQCTGMLKDYQEKAIKRAHAQYLKDHNKKAYYNVLDSMAKSNKILGRHAGVIKTLCDSAKVNFKPVRRGQAGHDDMKHAYSLISDQNRLICMADGYVTCDGSIIKGLGVKSAIKQTKQIKLSMLKALKPETGIQTVYQIVDQDTLAGAHDLQKLCKKVAILNFANAHHPGGGYLAGCNAQEEDLCRRTMLFPVLNYMNKKAGAYKIAHDTLLFTEGVQVIRKGWKDRFALLQAPETVCVITQAAYNLNTTMNNHDKVSAKQFSDGTKDKIIMQLRAAKHNGCDGIVLGAFGCGAFKNDPKIVAALYAQILKSPEFKNQFKFIRFSIPKGGKNFTEFDKALKFTK